MKKGLAGLVMNLLTGVWEGPEWYHGTPPASDSIPRKPGRY